MGIPDVRTEYVDIIGDIGPQSTVCEPPEDMPERVHILGFTNQQIR